MKSNCLILLEQITTLTSGNISWEIGKDFQMTVKCFLSYYRRIDVITPDGLLTRRNSIYNDIPFSMELSDKKLPFIDNLITKTDKKNESIFIRNQLIQNDVSYLSNHPKPCLKNIPFCLARRICIIVQNKNVK